jgi:hypothetical protein
MTMQVTKCVRVLPNVSRAEPPLTENALTTNKLVLVGVSPFSRVRLVPLWYKDRIQNIAQGETMRRREFIALMGANVAWPCAELVCWPLTARAQPDRARRIGVLLLDSVEATSL